MPLIEDVVSPPMRIFITSTPEELEPYQVAACDVAAELGHHQVRERPGGGHTGR